MRKLELLPLSALKPHPKNPKAHASKLLDKSLARFGYVDTIMRDDRTGLLASGHGRYETILRAREASPTSPPEGVELGTAGEWLVPVVTGWASKDDAEALAYLGAANKIGEDGGWHPEQLGKWLLELSGAGQMLENLVATGFTKSDVDHQLELLDPTADDDWQPPLTPAPGPPWVEDGLYLLGPHRFFVGDSLVEANRLELLGDKPVDASIADPPYAIFGRRVTSARTTQRSRSASCGISSRRAPSRASGCGIRSPAAARHSSRASARGASA